MGRTPRRKERLLARGIRRHGSKEAGFRYELPNGDAIRDTVELERIRSLRVPPAWRNVRIARSPRAAVQAIGEDSKGRTQYLYHARFRQRRDLLKFVRIVRFGESLPRLRRKVWRDLRKDEPDRDRTIAAAVRLLDRAFFRLGNERSVREAETYGLTTVRAEHVEIERDEIRFEFVGKWNKQHERAIRDSDVANVLRGLETRPGDRLFQFRELDGSLVPLRSHHVNEYIQSAIGREFSAKDFRTWAGTLLCAIVLGMREQGSTRRERTRQIRDAIEATAGLLHNTPAVCRSSYVCPALLHEFIDGTKFDRMRSTRARRPLAKTTLSSDERALLRFLRETIADRRRRPRHRDEPVESKHES